MPVYSLAATAALENQFSFGTSGLTVQAGLMSFRKGANVVTAAISIAEVYHQAVPGATGFTAEKLNTRSPAGNTTAYGESLTSETNSLVVVSGAGFACNWWLARRAVFPVATDSTDFLASDSANNSIIGQFSIEEDARSHRWSGKRSGRRTTRKGAYHLRGNNVNINVKTGAGAFTCIFPQFQTDTEWTDYSAWAAGHSQADAWNINLYGAAPVVAARRRAAIW